MPNKISMDKQYVTRDGLPVRVLCVDRDDEGFPVVAIAGAIILSLTTYGKWSLAAAIESPHDLVEVRPKHTRKIHLEFFQDGSVSASPKCRGGRLAILAQKVIEVEFVEGEGLDDA